MSSRVLVLPTIPDVTQVVTGRAIRAPAWRDLAHLNNWLMGRGAQLIPPTYCGDTLTKSTAYEFQFRVRPRYPATKRLWTIMARSASNSRASTLAIEIPSGGTAHGPFSVPGLRQSTLRGMPVAQPIRCMETVSKSAAEATATIKFTPTVEDCIIESIACVELPRDRINTTDADYGMDAERCVVEAPLWSDVSGVAGFYDMLRNFDGTQDIGARNGFFQWSVPYTSGGSETVTFARSEAAGTATNLFTVPPILLGRALALDNSTSVAGTTSTVSFRVLCKVDNAATTTGTVALTMASGASTSITSINSATWTWWPSTAGAAKTIAVDSTDMTVADGRRSTRWDTGTFTIQRTSGSGTLYVAALSMFEA